MRGKSALLGPREREFSPRGSVKRCLETAKLGREQTRCTNAEQTVILHRASWQHQFFGSSVFLLRGRTHLHERNFRPVCFMLIDRCELNKVRRSTLSNQALHLRTQVCGTPVIAIVELRLARPMLRRPTILVLDWAKHLAAFFCRHSALPGLSRTEEAWLRSHEDQDSCFEDFAKPTIECQESLLAFV